MADALDKVKALAADQRRLSEKNSDEAAAKTQSDRADFLEAVAHELEGARKRLRPIPASFGDLSDLPEEVIAQLSLTKVDELEQQLRDIVASGDGKEVGLDAIIIELYRRHKVIQDRRFIMNKLYRMSQKGVISGVEGRKGVYHVPKPWESGDWGSPANEGGAIDLNDDIPF